MNHTTLTVDGELVRQAKHHHINMSEALRDYLRILIGRQTQDIDGINIELERSKLAKLHKEMAELQIELNACESNIQKHEDLQQKKEEKRLQKEKETLEAMKKCINCGNFIQHKAHKFNNGNVCHSCFMSATGDQIKKWNEISKNNEKA